MPEDVFLAEYQTAAQRDLNAEQRAAIRHGKGPLFVMAGPGSGKSEVMVARALKLVLVDGVAPSSLFLTTFTEKAARNLQDRVATRLIAMGFDTTLDELRVGTLHSLCDRTMREFRYMQYADTRLLNDVEQSFFVYAHLTEWIKENVKADFWESFRFLHPTASLQYGPNQWQKVNTLVTLFNRLTDDDVDLDRMARSRKPQLKLLSEITRVYRSRLLDEHRSDFSTLLLHFREFLGSPSGQVFATGSEAKRLSPLRHVLVDEYQDTNPIQEDLYLRLGRACDGNITIVGDDDQALYRFRGGTVECIVRFTERVRDVLGLETTPLQLKTNYRSVPAITQWAEKVLQAQPEMNRPRARAPKKPMTNARPPAGEYPPVSVLTGRTISDVASAVAQLIKGLIKDRRVEDPCQIAVLLRSAKESPRNAGPLCGALRDVGVNIYNPRSKSFLAAEEVTTMLGALLELLDADSRISSTLGGQLPNTVTKWRQAYSAAVKQHSTLAPYVRTVHDELSRLELGKYLPVTLRDVFYRILSLEPFSTWQEDPERTFRLGQLSAILESFSSVERDTLRVSSKDTGRFSEGWLRARFYPRLIGYLNQASLDDPEDVDHQIVPGRVQVMTVHQAKGLEFPIVFVASLALEPKATDATFQLEDLLAPLSRTERTLAPAQSRAIQDLVRFYYVAFTRAENALILTGTANDLNRACISMARA